VFVDVLGRAPGRGTYIKPIPSVVEAALAPKGLARIFRGRARHLGLEAKRPPLDDVAGPTTPTTAGAIAAMVLDRATELVALARRAGQLEVGTEAVRQALEHMGPGSTLVLARDLGENTTRSVQERAERAAHGSRHRRFGTKASLGARLGRGPTGVLLCTPGPLADRIAAEGYRFEALIGSSAVRAESREQTREAVRASGGGTDRQEAHPVAAFESPSHVGPSGGEGRTTRYFE
jgi:ribosomal protein L7Ae-like RNA K-turn-binding protein